MAATRKRATKKVSKPDDLAGMTHEEAVDIYSRLQAMERSMQTFFDTFVEQTEDGPKLKPIQEFMDTFVEQTDEGPILRVMSKGTRATAKKGRVGLAAKRSGWTYEDWTAKFGDRQSRLSKEEMAIHNSAEQNRLEALHKERPARSPKGPASWHQKKWKDKVGK